MPLSTPEAMAAPGLKRWHSSAQLHRDKQHLDERPQFRERLASMASQKPSCCSSACILAGQAHPAVTETEFQNLPPSVQRKCFSTLERLQILHYSTDVYAHCQSNHNNITNKSRSRPRTSATAAARPTTSTSYGSSIRRRKKRNSLNLAQIEPRIETHFYLSLPDKIRRQQFSKEEQLRIQAQLEAGPPLHLDRSSPGSGRPSTTSSANLARRQSNSALRKDSKVPSIELLRPATEPMNCFDGKPARAESRRMRRPSLPRDASLHRPSSSVLSPKSQFSSPTLCSPTSPSFPSFPPPHHHRQLSSRTATMVRPSTESTISIDAAATYYQDPEARMKLRKYLASPQKFDEAVAFGFPSMPARTSTSERDPRTPHITSGNDAQNFLKDDVISFLDRGSSRSSNGDTVSYNDSPVTPASGEDIMPRVNKPYGNSIFAGLDRSDLPSLKFQFDGMSDIAEVEYEPEPSIFDPLANREMTLRMTLTRPELRATEEQLYGWAKENTDPLALETLQLSDDMTGQNGAFAVKPTPARNRRSGVFKKLLDKVKAR